MRVLFVYPTATWKGYHNGIAILSAVLKKAGHETAMEFIHNWKKRTHKNLALKILEFKPHLIAISFATNQFERAKQIINFINHNFSLPIIVGGIHPTICPNEVIKENILALCRGEGEEAILEFIEAFEKNKSYLNIKNFWFKQNGKIFKNPLRLLTQNLDALPYADYSIFDYQKVLDEFSCLEVFANRGCPYGCNYCINNTLMKLYKGKGKFVRYRSVKSLITELGSLISKYRGIKTIEFFDDTFVLNKKWLAEFANVYPKKIGIPFRCNARANLVDKETARLLKEAGCYMVSMAIETGNETLRRKILNKDITNKQIEEAFSFLKNEGIKLYAHNMVGIPYETPETIHETIDLNKKVGIDIVQCWVFFPYPGTKSYELCKKNNWISSRKVTNVASLDVISVLDQPSITKEEVSYYHKIMRPEICYPNSLKLVIFRKMAEHQQMMNLLLWIKHSMYKIIPAKLRKSVRKIL